MSEVILVVFGRPEDSVGLIAAAKQLAELVGDARIRALALPSLESGAAAPPVAGELAMETVAPDASVTATVEQRGSRADFIVVAQPDPRR